MYEYILNITELRETWQQTKGMAAAFVKNKTNKSMYVGSFIWREPLRTTGCCLVLDAMNLRTC